MMHSAEYLFEPEIAIANFKRLFEFAGDEIIFEEYATNYRYVIVKNCKLVATLDISKKSFPVFVSTKLF